MIYTIGSTSGIGKDQLKAYFQSQLSKGVTYVGSAGTKIQATGNIVTFLVEATGGAPVTYANSSAIVQDGLISILTLK